VPQHFQAFDVIMFALSANVQNWNKLSCSWKFRFLSVLLKKSEKPVSSSFCNALTNPILETHVMFNVWIKRLV